METPEKETTLNQEDREQIMRLLSWEYRIDSKLGELLLAASRNKVAPLWTMAGLVEILERRDQEIINKVEIYLDERHNFMKPTEDEKEAANF